jgi:UDP-N-acetylglucosamine 1-carboxyvinyltransferase
MGAQVRVSGQTAFFTGPARLVGTEVKALDLRSGAAMVLAGLAAEGETLVHAAHLIERGYADFAANMRDLGGACIPETLGA